MRSSRCCLVVHTSNMKSVQISYAVGNFVQMFKCIGQSRVTAPASEGNFMSIEIAYVNPNLPKSSIG